MGGDENWVATLELWLLSAMVASGVVVALWAVNERVWKYLVKQPSKGVPRRRERDTSSKGVSPKSKGAIVGQPPKNVGEAHSYKKLGKKVEKEKGKAGNRRKRGRAAEEGSTSVYDLCALKSIQLWESVHKEVFESLDPTLTGDKLVHAYASTASISTIAENEVDAFMTAYALSKLESACDETCCALVTAYEADPELRDMVTSSDALTITSLGGGPGNDAVGALLFASLVSTARTVSIRIGDKYPRWWYIACKILDHVTRAGLLEVEGDEPMAVDYEFIPIDLSKSGDDESNKMLMKRTDDIVVLSNCIGWVEEEGKLCLERSKKDGCLVLVADLLRAMRGSAGAVVVIDGNRFMIDMFNELCDSLGVRRVNCGQTPNTPFYASAAILS